MSILLIYWYPSSYISSLKPNIKVKACQFKFEQCAYEVLERKLLTRVSSTNVEDLVGGFNVLGDNIPETWVSLVPIELLLVFLVTVLPVFWLSVLGHILSDAFWNYKSQFKSQVSWYNPCLIVFIDYGKFFWPSLRRVSIWVSWVNVTDLTKDMLQNS